MKYKSYIFLVSFVLTIIVFGIGFMMSYGLDFLRIDQIVNVMQDHEINALSNVVEQDFISQFGGERCQLMKSNIIDLKREIVHVGADLTSYGGKSIFKKNDFDYLKRKYFLLELEFYSLLNDMNKECGKNLIPVLFFYKIDDDVSERQGLILDDLGQNMREEMVVLSFDIDYEYEQSLNLIKEHFNVTSGPTLIIDNDIIYEGVRYTSEINNTIQESLYDDGVDKYAFDMNFTFNANGINMSKYVQDLDNLSIDSNFTKGDILLVKGRILQDNEIICSSLKYYDKVSEDNKYLKALSYETIASIGCGRNKRAFYLEAAKLWREIGNDFRADVISSIALQKHFDFNYVDFDLSGTVKFHSDLDSVIIGDDEFLLDNSTVLVSQVDRVTRDWLGESYQNPYSKNILSVFSERFTYNQEELQSQIGWHEGGRIKDIGIEPNLAVGTLVKKFGDKWYSSNLNGNFMFEIPKDKLHYPTTRFLSEDLAVIIDTHGINMLVERAELLNASLVIGCCDNIGKIKAAKYLSKEGVDVICFTDKYLPLVMNQGLSIIGSPLITKTDDGVRIGGQEISISKKDKILVMNVNSSLHAISYYKTPYIYFSVFNELYPGYDIDYYSIEGFNEMKLFIEYARLIQSDVIAVRVFNSDDYKYVSKWLNEDKNHRAVLFHSTAYPYGLKLINEFKSQTTFDDININ